MRKKQGFKLSAVLLSFLIAVSVAAPLGGISVFAESEQLPAPTICTEPQFIYEIPSPEVKIPTDFSETFTPAVSGNAQSSAPVISSATQQASPYDSISLYGEGFSGGSVYIYGLKGGNGALAQAEVTSVKNDFINAVVPYDFDYSMYLVWVKGANGQFSNPVRVNAPKLTWLGSSETYAGNELRVYGKFLSNKNGTGKSYAYIVGSGKYYSAAVTEVTPYRIKITVPENLAAGEYKVYVHNGHGGDYGWSEGLELTVKTGSQNIWTGKTITVSAATEEALKAAIDSASDYDTIYLKNGTYDIRKGITVKKCLRFIGESKENTVIVSSITKADGSFNTGGNAIDLEKMPSAVSNITFTDNVTDFDIKTATSTFLKVSGYALQYSGTTENISGFKADNCNFIVKRLRSSSTNEHPEYEYYSSDPSAVPAFVLDYMNDSEVTNCYIEASGGINVRGCKNVYIHDTTSVGNWVMDGNSGSLGMFITSSVNLDISDNKIHGKDLYTDPDGTLERYDLTFGRGIVVQTPTVSQENTYIMNNDLDRIGEAGANSGEMILFEDLSKFYIGTLSSVSEDTKTLTLSSVPTEQWRYETVDGTGNKEYCFHAISETTGEYSLHGRVIKGQYAAVIKGKGKGQYRKITDVTANSVTVDRAWDVAPDENSVVMLMRSTVNSVLYNNSVTGPENFNNNYNATAGIQAYASMLGLTLDRNTFENMHIGFYLDPHYNQKTYTVNDKSFKSDNGYNVFIDTLIMNNSVTDVRYGAEIKPIIHREVLNGDLTAEEESAELILGLTLRRNKIRNCFNSTAVGESSQVGRYKLLEGLGGTAFVLGTTQREFKYQYNGIGTGKWMKDVVIENNTVRAAESSYFKVCYQQEGTVIRNNDLDRLGRRTETLEFEGQLDENHPISEPIYHCDYGTSANGMFSAADNVESFENLKNGSFDEGLKYWASRGLNETADKRATVETENSDNYIKITSKNGIKSVGFGASGISDGTRLALIYDSSNGTDLAVTLGGRGLYSEVSNGRLLKNASSRSGFVKCITDYATVAPAADYSAVDLNVYLGLKGFAKSAAVDNIELVKVNEEKGYFETLSGERYYLSDGGEYGGTEGSGLVPKDAGDIFEYSPEDGLKNADFAEGFKYWTDISGTRPASSNASVSSGKVTMRGPKESGIMSAPFKINKDSLSSINSENRVAFIIRYTSGTSYTVDLYKNGVKTGTASTGNNAAGKLKFIYFTGVTWDENAVYNIAVKKQNAVDAVIDSISLARCTSGRVVTEFESGAMYASNAEIGGSESGGMSTSSYTSDKLINGDFAMGLKYWIQTSAAVSGREVTLASGTLKSMSFRSDKGVYAVYRYKTASSGATVSFGGSAQSIPQSTQYTYGTVRKDTTSAASAIEFKGDITLSYVGIVTLSGGIYTDIKTGEQFNASDLSPYGGTAEDGFLSKNSSQSVISAVLSAETFLNRDFSEGLRFWTSNISNTGYASDFAALSNGVVTLKLSDKWDGIASCAFTLPNAAAGRKVVLRYEANCGDGLHLRLFVNNGVAAQSLANDTDGKWQTFKSGVYTIDDVTAQYFIDIQSSNPESVISLRNICLCYIDDGGSEACINLDGSPADTVYGDADENGIVDIRDYIRIIKYISGSSAVTLNKAAANLDKDSDISVTASDITYLKEYLVTGVKKF